MNNIRTLKQNDETRKDQVKGKVIISSDVARQLLRERVSDNVRIIDIKPDRSDKTGRASVFVFEDNEDFQKTFSAIIDKRRDRRKKIENLVTDEVKAQITAAVLAKIKADQEEGE